jgi:hypothetical protein
VSPAAVSVDRYGFIENEKQPQRTDLGLRLHDSLFSNAYFVCSCLMCFAWRFNQKIEKRTLHIVHSGILCLHLASNFVFLSVLCDPFLLCLHVCVIYKVIIFRFFFFWSAAGGAGDGPDHVFVGGLPSICQMPRSRCCSSDLGMQLTTRTSCCCAFSDSFLVRC